MIKRVAARLSPSGSRRIPLLLGVLPLALITGYIVVAKPNLDHLSGYGYAGVFGLMLVSNATVFLPMPGLAAVAAAGMVWNPLLVGLAGGLGGAVGELAGYLAGYGVHGYVEAGRARWLQRIKGAVQRYGFPGLVLLASIPNPFFDIVGVAAGSLAYPPWRFFLAIAIGNSIKCAMVAHAGGAFRVWIP